MFVVFRRKTIRFELKTQDSQAPDLFIGHAAVKRLTEELQKVGYKIKRAG